MNNGMQAIRTAVTTFGMVASFDSLLLAVLIPFLLLLRSLDSRTTSEVTYIAYQIRATKAPSLVVGSKWTKDSLYSLE